MKLFETSAAVLAAAADGGGCKWVPLGWGGGMVVNFNIFVINTEILFKNEGTLSI